MNLTDASPNHPNRQAGSFFADWLLPLKHARLRRGQHYFHTVPDAATPSYWQAPATRGGGVQRCPITEADASALLAALVPHWLAQGDDDLVLLADALEALRQQLAQGQPSPASAERPRAPSYSAYPLF